MRYLRLLYTQIKRSKNYYYISAIPLFKHVKKHLKLTKLPNFLWIFIIIIFNKMIIVKETVIKILNNKKTLIMNMKPSYF